jgi:hypothetical protein
MRRRIVAASSLLLLPLLMGQTPIPGTVPTRTPKQFYMMGSGINSCAKAFADPVTERISVEWAFGYFTDRNEQALALVGQGTDREGIVGELKLYCQNHPSDLFVIAIARTYEKLAGH